MMQFLPTIAKQLGFSEDQVGNIFLILPISGLIAKPLFGSLADKFQFHKIFFILFQVMLASAFFTIYFIPEADSSTRANFTCDGVSFLALCSKKPFTSAEAVKATKDNNSCCLTCDINSLSETKILCESWKIEKYCFLSETAKESDIFNEKIEFEAKFNASHYVAKDNCLHIRVFSALFADGDVHRTTCSSNLPLRISCKVQCPKVPFLHGLINDVNKAEFKPNYFRWFLQASVVSWIGMAIVVSVADTICFDLLGESKSKDYGKQSMWGSIGVGLFSVTAGYVIDVVSKKSERKDYSFLFYLVFIFMSIDVLVSATIKKKSLKKSEPSVLWELGSILKEGRVLVFAWWCIGAGMCTAVIWNFLNLYIEGISSPEDKKWSKTLQGLIAGVQCFLGQLPFNFMSGNILHKVGHINVMSLVLLVYAIRFMAYSLITNVWMVLLIEFLHGPSFGLSWPTMVSYGDKVAPSGTKATIQGIVGAVFEGIGVAFGSFICGHLMHIYKGVVTLRIFSAGALVWLTSYWILQLFLRRVKAYPLQRGHTHLAHYIASNDSVIKITEEKQTY